MGGSIANQKCRFILQIFFTFLKVLVLDLRVVLARFVLMDSIS